MTETHAPPKTGWASFASLLFLLASIFNLIAGIAALVAKDKFDETSMLYENVRLAGIFWLMIGLLQLLTAAMIWKRNPSGRILGICMALVSACLWFFALDARPLAALVVIGVNILLMYGLTKSADEFTSGSLPPDDPRARQLRGGT